MKKIALLILIFFISKLSYGQLGLYYHDSLIWQYRTYWVMPPSGPGQGPTYYYTYYNYFVNGDTLINGFSYKRLYSSNSTSSSFFNFSSLTLNSYLYEHDNCVYKGSIGQMKKILDYNLLIGDSFLFNGYNTKLKLLNIDSVLLYGNYFHRYSFERGIIWIEGMGDVIYGASFGSYYFLNPPDPSWMDRGSQFRCYSENLVPLYGINSCDLPLIISQAEVNRDFSIYPNPVFNDLYIEKSDNVNYNIYEIYSVFGDCVKKGILNDRFSVINLVDLSSGIYFIKVEDKNRDFFTKSFVKN